MFVTVRSLIYTAIIKSIKLAIVAVMGLSVVFAATVFFFDLDDARPSVVRALNRYYPLGIAVDGIYLDLRSGYLSLENVSVPVSKIGLELDNIDILLQIDWKRLWQGDVYFDNVDISGEQISYTNVSRVPSFDPTVSSKGTIANSEKNDFRRVIGWFDNVVVRKMSIGVDQLILKKSDRIVEFSKIDLSGENISPHSTIRLDGYSEISTSEVFGTVDLNLIVLPFGHWNSIANAHFYLFSDIRTRVIDLASRLYNREVAATVSLEGTFEKGKAVLSLDDETVLSSVRGMGKLPEDGRGENSHSLEAFPAADITFQWVTSFESLTLTDLALQLGNVTAPAGSIITLSRNEPQISVHLPHAFIPFTYWSKFLKPEVKSVVEREYQAPNIGLTSVYIAINHFGKGSTFSVEGIAVGETQSNDKIFSSSFAGTASDRGVSIKADGEIVFTNRFVPAASQKGWEFHGPLKYSLHWNGVGATKLELLLDATPMRIGYKELIDKAIGDPFVVSVPFLFNAEKGYVGKGEVTALSQINYGDFSFQLPNGIESKRGGFTFSLALNTLDLKKAATRFPFVSEYHVNGTADGTFNLRVGYGEPFDIYLPATISDAGITLPTPLIAPFTHLDGEVVSTHAGLSFKDTTAELLGDPVELSGRVEDFRNIALDLDFSGTKVRTDRFIFPSGRDYFHHLAGKLHVSPEGIQFKNVQAQLDDGTHIDVTGAMESFSEPKVVLVAESNAGNIDTVIDLFLSEYDDLNVTEEAPPSSVPIDVDFVIQKGVYEPLTFTNAQGHLHYQSGDILVHPLRFNTARGSANVMVTLLSRKGKESLLKLSGRVVDIDAFDLYRDVFDEESLLSGTARADFYLEGVPGENFWRSTFGGVYVSTEDGVIRKYSTLAKVFSILNVSQIFSLKLPDMAKGGMPYDRLTSSVSILNGIATTNDLAIESRVMNLSLIGSLDIVNDEVDYLLGIRPLQTVDKIISKIPLVGWIIAGEEKAVVTAHFKITGKAGDPKVSVVPVTSLSGKVLGIFRRVFQLPKKLVTDVVDLFDREGTE